MKNNNIRLRQGKKVYIIFAVALIIATTTVTIFGCSMIPDSTQETPEAVAEKYYNALLAGDVDTAWELLAVKESAFVSKARLAEAMSVMPAKTLTSVSESSLQDKFDKHAVDVYLDGETYFGHYLVQRDGKWLMDAESNLVYPNIEIRSDIADAITIDDVYLEKVDEETFHTGPIIFGPITMTVKSHYYEDVEATRETARNFGKDYGDFGYEAFTVHSSTLDSEVGLKLKSFAADQLMLEAPDLMLDYMEQFFAQASVDEVERFYYKGNFDRNKYRADIEKYKSTLDEKPFSRLIVSDVTVSKISETLDNLSIPQKGFTATLSFSGTAEGVIGYAGAVKRRLGHDVKFGVAEWDLQDIKVNFRFDEDVQAYRFDGDTFNDSVKYRLLGTDSPQRGVMTVAEKALSSVKE